jgi:VIT1/CCC1 family predicted Fe2+/Mn2+ transporter
MAHDKLEAHARDELGITKVAAARPFQAAWTSAIAFTAGAAAPLLSISLPPTGARIPLTVVVSLLALVALGALGARAGGASWRRASLRVVSWSSVAMAITYAIGRIVGANV